VREEVEGKSPLLYPLLKGKMKDTSLKDQSLEIPTVLKSVVDDEIHHLLVPKASSSSLLNLLPLGPQRKHHLPQ